MSEEENTTSPNRVTKEVINKLIEDLDAQIANVNAPPEYSDDDILDMLVRGPIPKQ